MEDEHGHGDASHDVHLPDPSPWPLVAGVAALLLGAAIVWWARDTGSNVAAVALGAAGAVALFAVGGWAYEDGRMRMKAAEGESHGPAGATRFTQVLAFSIAEGQLETARGTNGVLATIEGRDSALRDLAGFQDLRIVVAPADEGPSQVLVETTWADREGLATYDETRETLLDLLNQHPDEVVAGSVQVFDMEVVRDTKDVSVRFGMGTAAALLGSLIIGGFFVGAGLTLFEGEGGGGGGGGGPTPAPTGFAQTGVMVAKNISFQDTQITLPPGIEFTFTLDNQDNGTPHDIQFFQGSTPEGPFLTGCTDGCAGGGTDVNSEVITGPTTTQFTFTTPDPGQYAFHCSIHPQQMQGVLTVEQGAPVPGQGGGGGGGGAGENTIVAQNIAFSPTNLEVPANTAVTLTFDNKDNGTPHNIEFFQGDTPGQGPFLTGCTDGCNNNGSDVVSPDTTGPEQVTFTFTSPDPGTYAFQCKFHPQQMTGTLTVK